jgi:hypothetical protein
METWAEWGRMAMKNISLPCHPAIHWHPVKKTVCHRTTSGLLMVLAEYTVYFTEHQAVAQKAAFRIFESEI